MPDKPLAEAHRRREARTILAIFSVIAVAGLFLGWSKGQLPHRGEPAIATGDGAAATAPDLALYGEIIGSVRSGSNYYATAREAIPRYGFPIASPLNWRLPTYAGIRREPPIQGRGDRKAIAGNRFAGGGVIIGSAADGTDNFAIQGQVRCCRRRSIARGNRRLAAVGELAFAPTEE